MGRLNGLLVVIIVLVAALARPAAAFSGPIQAIDARAAEHGEITRFVLELSRSVPFSLTAATDGRQLTIELPELDWQVDKQMLGRGVGLLQRFAYSVTKPGAGRLSLEMSQPATVKKAFLIPPVAGDHYRLVIDLQSAAATPCCANAAPDRDGARRAPAKLPVVVIDPGHGGVDPGATSITGAYEKNIVLALAHEVKAQLDKGGKVVCQLTRDRDVFIPLRDRVEIARQANADLFISLHADTVDDPSIHGLSVYTLSQNASDAEAQALADKENKSDIVAGIDLSNESPEVTNILISLAQRESLNASALFAQTVIAEVAHETSLLPQNTHRFAGFAVLKAPDIPSILVETGYLSNPKDEQMLRRPDFRAKLATAIARAVERYFARPRKGHRI